MQFYWIILASGKGSRVGLPYNKVFAKTQDSFLLKETLERIHHFNDLFPNKPQYILVSSEDDLKNPETYSLLKDLSPFYTQLIQGGQTRVESSYLGLVAAKKLAGTHLDNCFALVHDAARPLLSQKLIKDCIKTLVKEGSAIPVLPVINSVRLLKNGKIVGALDRDQLVEVQTPQGAKLDNLIEATEKAMSTQTICTDESEALLNIGIKPACFNGDIFNLKITQAADFERYEHYKKVISEN